MQLFGKLKTKHELDYIVKTYLYLNKEGEEISSSELELLLKKKNKNVSGTVFLYNPFTVPKGYNKEEKLIDQGFIFTDKFVELEEDDASRVLARSLKKKYEGKLIEIKYLFNYNKDDIQPTSVLEVFEMDIEKLHTNQLTVFSKEYNFQDYKNISYNGKFIFFAWGHKFEKAHSNISIYATNIAQWAIKQGKEVGFIYDETADKEESFEYTKFIHPVAFGKMKQMIPIALEKVFSKDKVEPLCIKDI